MTSTGHPGARPGADCGMFWSMLTASRPAAWLRRSVWWLLGAATVFACSANSAGPSYGSTGSGTGGSAGAVGAGGQGAIFDASDDFDEASCTPHCSADHRAILGCGETVVQSCAATDLCADAQCLPACDAAAKLRSSVGCEYWPVMMQGYGEAIGGCFAVVVANTWPTAAHVSFEFKGAPLDPTAFGALPSGSGTSLQYAPYQPTDGIPANEVGIFFLAGPDATGSGVECPIASAIMGTGAQVSGSGKGNAFHVTSDVPVVAYQILPYGGGSAAVTGASLLLPTSVWDTNYVAVNAYGKSNINTRPSLNIVAMQDGTQVTMVPRADVTGTAGIPSTSANQVMTIQLNRGEQAQITQVAELTGSPIQSNFPVALMAGHECAQIPQDKGKCDHAEQQIPGVRALGSEYVAVSYRQRSSAAETPQWRIVGAVDGTSLTFDPPSAHAAQTIGFGEVLLFGAAEPFVVRSQDANHPFLINAYMTGSDTVQAGYGDPDFVRVVPPQQYLQKYVFFTDPTYPETDLVLVRASGSSGFADVELDCLGKVGGWSAVGTEGKFEFTRVDLVRHDFAPQGSCDNGRHVMSSDEPFGLWVWGWGTPETTSFTSNVSYGYPAGESVLQLNDVFIPPVPR